MQLTYVDRTSEKFTGQYPVTDLSATIIVWIRYYRIALYFSSNFSRIAMTE